MSKVLISQTKAHSTSMQKDVKEVTGIKVSQKGKRRQIRELLEFDPPSRDPHSYNIVWTFFFLPLVCLLKREGLRHISSDLLFRIF